MRKHTDPVRLDTHKPRYVFRAMLALGKRSAKHGPARREHAKDQQDLAQRVREMGEW